MKCLYFFFLLLGIVIFMSCERVSTMIPTHPTKSETRRHTHRHIHFHKHSPEHAHEHEHEHGHREVDDLLHDFANEFQQEHAHEVDCIEHHGRAFDEHVAHDIQECINEAESLLNIESVLVDNIHKTETHIFKRE